MHVGGSQVPAGKNVNASPLNICHWAEPQKLLYQLITFFFIACKFILPCSVTPESTYALTCEYGHNVIILSMLGFRSINNHEALSVIPVIYDQSPKCSQLFDKKDIIRIAKGFYSTMKSWCTSLPHCNLRGSNIRPMLGQC